MPNELLGRQAERVGLVCVTLTSEQLEPVSKGTSPPAPESLRDTKYMPVTSVPGTRKETRREVPISVITETALVEADAAPPQVVDSLTITLAGVICPAGKLLPITLT